jgi:hypothetical protein
MDGAPRSKRLYPSHTQVAALPQLVEALEWALDDPDSEILGEEWAKAAQAAIAKAKGERDKSVAA